ncbi:hypothetical protein CYLTODRAFT_439299 [Cylindrobasidium torrendii FP15055 ss-10]|uniref:Conserved oligomeric Golgi complex subunit 7 n=1 Tax=Cylindrobasidium torrendii FP15055 ss-10 TaxID=1314674 RepID=A0A0D7BW38_9AGAR|nr:hypothetical protein CYLTODRAFT_439299 [Cylindrobasidium torrendii FP15055 ss-10]
MASSLESLGEYDDIVAWVNDTLPIDSDVSELDQSIVQLLASLDIAAEDTSSQLERTIDDVARSVPRLTYDLHFMNDGASTLQSALRHVCNRAVAVVPDPMKETLDHLRTLDKIKTNMEAARDVLREAESWSTLEMEVTGLLGDQQYAKAAARLSEASRSMVVFQNTPEYDPRRSLMTSLQNQLEASLSSALVSAINIQDLPACKDYFAIFSDIQRESEFRNYYNGSRKAPLATLWQSTRLKDCDEDEGVILFADFLPKFYEQCLTVLHHERNVMPEIFPDPLVSFSAFLLSALSGLQPSISHRLSTVSNHYGDAVLQELITLFKTTEDFARSVQNIMEKMKLSSSSEDTAVSPPAPRRRKSIRMSMSWRSAPVRASSSTHTISSKLASLSEWEQELFQPFLEFQVDYASLERRFLDNTLMATVTLDTSRPGKQDVARLLRERAVDAFGAAEESMNRCMAFTHGYAAVGLVQALDSFFKSFMDMWRREMHAQLQPSAHISPDEPEDEENAGLDYTSADWAVFQLSLHLLSSARSVHERLLSFESKLRVNITHISTSFRLAREDPQTFAMSASLRHLEQSVLQSAELQTLLEPQRPGQPEPLLLEARSAISECARTCQDALQHTILSPLIKALEGYASLPLWTAVDEVKPSANPKEVKLHIPSFSLDPSDNMKRVAEGLLNLPRLFEGYGDDDALAFSLDTLPHAQAASTEPSTPAPMGHARRQSVSAGSKQAVDREAISGAWLSSFGRTFLLHLTLQVLPSIQDLTPRGAAQLASDLGYLSNIVGALNVEGEDLSQWRRCVEADDLDAVSVKDDIWREVLRMRR